MTYNLGIDIGIASLGFAGVVENQQQILFANAHIFEAAENPKDGSSLAKPRREKRGLRRVIRRRAQRKRAIRSLLAQHGFNDLDVIDMSRNEARVIGVTKNVWDWRKEALQRKLSDGEFAHVLFHIAKKRGFQSNRKGAEPNDLEGKKALSGAKEFQEAMFRANAPTVGAYLATLPKKRNGDGAYDRFVTRDLLCEEINKVFAAQQRHGNSKATATLKADYEAIAFFQRPLQSSEGLVGYCALEPSEKRAPRFAYSAELFVLWSRINNTKIRSQNGEERFLTADERHRLADLSHKNKGGVSYKQARKELELGSDERFNIGYRKTKESQQSWEDIRDEVEKARYLQLAGYQALKEALSTGSTTDWQQWIGAGRDALDDIARILSFYEDGTEIERMLRAHALSGDQVTALMYITNFSKTVDLSLKAIRVILPFMQQGLTYDKACAEAGYHHSQALKRDLSKVPPFDDVRNPVVNRALGQARKVINAAIRTHGMPDKIIVEMARDVGKSFKDRKDIEREQKKNEAYREEARQHMAEILGIPAENLRSQDILKYRLWKEQNGFCPYSGQYIEPVLLRDSLATQIDHIIPYQRSWNDSYMNKTLCLTSENQRKGNRIPREYLSESEWGALQAFVGRTSLPPKKAEHLLMETFDDEKAGAWKDRALNDTRYMARLLKNHLEQSLAVKVETRNGALTANLRGAWGFPDKDRRNDRHHALDAIVLACSTQSMVQKLSSWNKYEARKQNPSERPLPPKPWETFREDAKAAINAMFVSRMPVRTITGAAHEETIRSIRHDSDGNRQIIQRIKLSSLTPAALENLVDKERNIKLYNLLKARLDAFGGKADKAFAEPVYMPVNDPTKPAPRIHAVRVVTNEKSGIEINGGLASNGDMVRVDVFRMNGKFQLVPIYVHHFAKATLPNKAIVAFKDEEQWTVVDDKDFIFSLYKNDLVRIKSRNEDAFGYYVGVDRSTGGISIRAHDNDPGFGKEGLKRGIGVKTLETFEKYTVDYFGNRTLVVKEPRHGLAQCDDSEPSEVEPC